MSEDSSQSNNSKRLVRPRSVADLTPENAHLADFDRIQVRVAILCKSVAKLKGVESFLGRRGWEVLLTDRIGDVLSTLSSHPVDFVFISVNHSNPKVKHLPNIVNFTFKSPCVLFGESTDARTINAMQTIRANYKMLGVVSGPMIQRRIKQILKELFRDSSIAEMKLNEGENLLWRALNETANAPSDDDSTKKVFANADVRLLKKVMNVEKYEKQFDVGSAESGFTFGSKKQQTRKKKSWAERLAEVESHSKDKKLKSPDWLQGADSEEEFVKKKKGYQLLEKEVTSAVAKGELPESYLDRIHKMKEEIDEFENIMIGGISTSSENSSEEVGDAFGDVELEVKDIEKDLGSVEVSEIPEDLYETLEDKFELDEIEQLRKKVLEAKQEREDRHQDKEEELIDVADILGAPLPPSIRSQRKQAEGEEDVDDEELIHLKSQKSAAAKAAQEIRDVEAKSGKVSLRKKLKSWMSDMFLDDIAESSTGEVETEISEAEDVGKVNNGVEVVKGSDSVVENKESGSEKSEQNLKIENSEAGIGKAEITDENDSKNKKVEQPKTASQQAAEHKVKSQASLLLQLLTDTLDETAELQPPNEKNIKPVTRVGGLSLRVGPHQGFVFFAAESEDNLTMLFRRFSVMLWDACNDADSELEIGQETVTDVPIEHFFDIKVPEPGFSIRRTTAAGRIGLLFIPDPTAMKVAESHANANDLEVSAADIGSAHDVNFDIFTYFPINDKRIRLLTLGNHFSKAQEERFVKNNTKLLIPKESRRMFELHAFGNKIHSVLTSRFNPSKKKAS